jgi:hypothetical protein
MSVGDVMAALTAGQESGRLPELREDTTVADQLKALAWDSLNVGSGLMCTCDTQEKALAEHTIHLLSL